MACLEARKQRTRHPRYFRKGKDFLKIFVSVKTEADRYVEARNIMKDKLAISGITSTRKEDGMLTSFSYSINDDVCRKKDIYIKATLFEFLSVLIEEFDL